MVAVAERGHLADAGPFRSFSQAPSAVLDQRVLWAFALALLMITEGEAPFQQVLDRGLGAPPSDFSELVKSSYGSGLAG